MFGAIKLTGNSDIDKYEYAGCGIGFDLKRTFSHPSAGTGANVVIFGADMSSSVNANNKTKSILTLGKGFTQGLEDTTFYAEKMYSMNLTATRKKFCLSLHYNGDNSYLLVNGTEIINFKTKHSEIEANPLCLGNPLSSANMKETRLYGSVFNFSVDYRLTAVDDILDIYKYLMKKSDI